MNLSLKRIRIDGGTQPRSLIDEQVVADYIEDMVQGDTFPAVAVTYDGESYWLTDGYHRVAAAKSLGLAEIAVDVKQGTHRDAVLASVGANAKHGQRRTNTDKRRVVQRLLEDSEWAAWSDSEIARRCAVTQQFVSKLRSHTTVVSENEQRTYTNKHGEQATMQTSGIGKTKRSRQGISNSDANRPIPVKPLLDYDAPIYLHDAISAGRVGVVKAIAVWDALRNVTEHVRYACIQNEVLDEQAVVLLNTKRHTDTGQAILDSGYLQDEENALPLSEASAWDVQGLLRKGEQEHRRAGIDLKIASQLAKIQQAPDGVYSVIYADPPWKYDNAGNYGASERHYPTLDSDQIATLLQDIQLSVAENAVLFLWATNPLLIDALQVVAAWGFEYKTNLCWDKRIPTHMGFYAHGQHELLLIATRGSFQPNFKYPSVICEEKTSHSAKPSRLYSMIEAMYPSQRYMELFARYPEQRPDWAFWGAELERAS